MPEQLSLFDNSEQKINAGYQIICADVLKWAKETPPIGAMAMLCDPPYHLISDTRNGSQRNPGTGPYGRHTVSTKGFMNSEWDGGDIAFQPSTWKALAQHLLPGAFIMAFASSRGFHRVMTAMEDAGLRLYPAIFGWLSGQSFPKATRIDAVLEKQRHDDIRPVCRFLRAAMEHAGMTSEAIATHFEFHPRMVDHWAARNTDSQPSVATWDQWLQLKALLSMSDEMDAEVWRLNGRKGQPGEMWAQREVIGERNGIAHHGIYGDYAPSPDTAPATPLAQTWAGHRYGGQMLKNSLEPIIVAQVPYAGKPVQSIVEHGSGALNIAGSRVGVGEQWWERGDAPDDEITRMMRQNHSGRWPPNMALVHSPQCVQVGTRQVRGSAPQGNGDQWHAMQNTVFGHFREHSVSADYTDADGQETVADWDCAPDCVVAALDRQAGVRTSGGSPHNKTVYQKGSRGIYGDFPAMPSHAISDSGSASRFFFTADWSDEVAEQLAQADPVRYCAKASRGERDKGLEEMPLQSSQSTGWSGDTMPERYDTRPGRTNQQRPMPQARNVHPTVKPIALCQWLATILLPPAAYAPRRLLVPFSGTSSEMVGAMLAGWEEILGIEQDATYVELAEHRLAYWAGRCV